MILGIDEHVLGKIHAALTKIILPAWGISTSYSVTDHSQTDMIMDYLDSIHVNYS